MSFKASTAEIPTRVRAEAIDPLALAVVACSSTPLLLLDGDLELIAASTSFCRAFEIDPGEVTRRSLPDLGRGEWGAPQLGSLLKATASGYGEVDSCELDLEPAGREPRHLVVKAQRLDCGAAGSVRLVLSVTDVTDARLAQQLKDDLLRDNAMLLQELQHRVANGLQIIAGVLMQSARRVQSAETRGHLHDAHHRIMSVAALQRQLAGSKLDTVEMRPYLEELCASIAGSMVHDHDQLSLSVTIDDGSTGADAAVSWDCASAGTTSARWCGSRVLRMVPNSATPIAPPIEPPKVTDAVAVALLALDAVMDGGGHHLHGEAETGAEDGHQQAIWT